MFFLLIVFRNKRFANVSFLFFCSFRTWRLRNLELTPRTLGKGKVNVVELLYYVRTFTNALFLFFFVDFGLGDLELTPRTLGKVIVKVVELCVSSLLCKNVY